MRVWVVCFVVFFSAAELYQWVQRITLPMPVLIGIGAILAIASNADKFGQRHLVTPSVETVTSVLPASESRPSSSAQASIPPAQTSIPPASAPVPANPPPPSRAYPGAQLPGFTSQSWQSIPYRTRPLSPSPQPSVTEQPDSRE